MKLFLDASVVRAPLSGVQLAVRNQVLALLPHPLCSQATVLSRDHVIREAASECAVPCLQPPATARLVLRRVLWQQFELPRLLDRGQAEALFAAAYTAPLRCATPYLLQVHDVIALDHPEWCSWPNARHMRMLLPGSVRRAAAVIASSAHVVTRLLTLFDVPTHRVHRVPLGVAYATFSAPAPRPDLLGPDSERPYLLFVGNLEPKKGLQTLAQAYGNVAEKLACDMVLAGRNAWKCGGLLKQIRAYRGSGRFRLLGRVPEAQLPGLYQHALAFVFPSLTEGFGLPVLEAMAAGAPVVHSDHAAVLETAGQAGCAFRVGDAEDLARTLVKLKESEQLRAELRERGEHRARTLSWQRWAEHVAPLLGDLSSP